MAIDEKVLEEKVAKGQSLTKEETEYIMRDEGPVEGYTRLPGEGEGTGALEAPKQEDAPLAEEQAAQDAKKKEDEAAAAAAAKPADKDSVFLRLEREMVKEEGKEDFTGWSEIEKGYFQQMRRDRKARQKAQEEADAAKFREIKLKKELDEAKKPLAKAEDDPLAKIKAKDPGDFLTVAEVLELVGSIQKPTEKAPDDKPAGQTQQQIDKARERFLRMCDNEARTAHGEDYDAVMELTGEILETNPEYLGRIAQAIVAGENPAIVSYELIKKDPAFAALFPVAKTRVEARKASGDATKKAEEKPAVKPAPAAVKTAEELQQEADAKKAEEALKANKDKTKTTGHVGAGEGKTAEEVTMEDISKMSDREFARLPKKTRDKYLALHG